MKKLIGIAALCVFLSAQFASAGAIRFTDAWKSLSFFGIPATHYKMNGRSVEITARNSSSVIYRPLLKTYWKSTMASWSWETFQSVQPTDLSKKGMDDRNISLYFVFLDKLTAERIGQTASIRKLLISSRARLLIYSFGGDKPRDTVQKNPYLGDRGVTIIKRLAAPGAFDEKVDLAADYRDAFNAEPEALVGIALASDSDDTNGLVIARTENLRLE